MAGSVFAPLRNRPFSRLFYGQLVSNFGDWLDFLALNALVAYRWDLGAAALATVAVARMLPLAICGPLAGVWADRLPRRTLMVACDLLRAGLALSLIWAPNLLIVAVIVALKALVSTFFDPAQQGALRALVPEEALLGANTLSMLSRQLSKVLAPLLGGMLVAAASPQAAFAADSLSFLVSALFILKLPDSHVGATSARVRTAASGEAGVPDGAVAAEGASASRPTATGGVWMEFKEGLRYILSRRLLTVIIGCMAAGFFILFLYDTFLALLTKTCGIGESGYGLIVSSVAMGSILGSLATGQWGDRWNPLKLMVATTITSGLLVALAGLDGLGWFAWNPAVAQAVIWFLIGFTGGAVQVYSGYLMQLETPKEYMGRVWSIASTMQNVFPFVGPVVGAAIVGWVGVGGVFVLSGGAYVVMGIVIAIIIGVFRLEMPKQAMTSGG